MNDHTPEDVVVEVMALDMSVGEVLKDLIKVGCHLQLVNSGHPIHYINRLLVLIAALIMSNKPDDRYDMFQDTVKLLQDTINLMQRKNNYGEEYGIAGHAVSCDCSKCKENVQKLVLAFLMQELEGLENSKDLDNFDCTGQVPN